MIEKVKKIFKEQFNKQDPIIYFSPGRVNIIGEHIDYNGGKVLPMAISLGIFGAINYNETSLCEVYSDSFNQKLSFDVNSFEKDNSFLKYIKGIIYILRKHQYLKEINGFNLVLCSTLPPSSGLSSSAALELLIIKMLNDRYNLGLDDIELVKLSQETEREYVGVNCGIMDQFAIGMSKKNYAIYLDTNPTVNGNYQYQYIDFKIDNATLVIINTNKPRNLVESKYNERREECESGLNKLQSMHYHHCLCDYTIDELNDCKNLLEDNIYRRLHHVITENQRVISALDAMKNGDFEKLGNLLNLSHQSLKKDYEVSGIHLDLICEELQKNSSVLGSRMTGAGFGGCAIALFKGNNHLVIDNILDDLKSKYRQITGIELDYYYVESSDKTSLIDGE